MWQMLRGSTVVFTAILSVFVHGRKLRGYHITGIAIVVCSFVVLGFACSHMNGGTVENVVLPQLHIIASTDRNTWAYIIAIVLVMSAQFLASTQFIFEETLLKRSLDPVPPMLLVGLEGLWGLLACFVLLPSLQMLPFCRESSVKSFWDSVCEVTWGGEWSTISMLRNRLVLIVALIYFMGAFAFNMCSILTTNAFTAVHHTIFDGSRTACVSISYFPKAAANFARSHPQEFEGSLVRFLLEEEVEAEEEIFGADDRHKEEELYSDEEAYAMYQATTGQEIQAALALQMLDDQEEVVDITPTISIKQEPESYLPLPPLEHRGPPVMFWKAEPAGNEWYTTSTEAETNCTTTTRGTGTVQVKMEPMNEDAYQLHDLLEGKPLLANQKGIHDVLVQTAAEEGKSNDNHYASMHLLQLKTSLKKGFLAKLRANALKPCPNCTKYVHLIFEETT
ncbi:hypothetical protein Pelo_4069 [Pelomyxa schiedti]|nr:hypothetical protein Pelo_4069 [Pelomyxa schiedti]